MVAQSHNHIDPAQTSFQYAADFAGYYYRLPQDEGCTCLSSEGIPTLHPTQ